MRPHRKLFYSLVVTALALIGVSGCSDGKVARFPVKGSVNVDGKPADGAMVIFCPLESASEKVQRMRPFGFTGADGKFELTTLDKADGSPAGEYKVLIQWPATSGGDQRDGARSLGPDRLRGRYMNLEKTQLVAKIEEGPTELPPFELKSK